MKVFIAIACLCVCAQANLLPAATIATKVISTGESSQSRTQDAAGNYAFAYQEQHGDGGSSRKESGDSWGNKQGSYTLNVADGRQRVVKYVADGLGFRAAISTNEPGTAAQPAAATSISSPYLPPQPVVAAPVLAAPALAAPALGDHGLGLGLGAPLGLAGPALGLGLGKGLAVAAPIAVAAVPAVSSYSTAINHAAPIAIAAPAPAVLAGHGLGLAKGGWY